jgi:mRNA-degrading endonuclease toxin of MazEF toxin-antitoxin module
MPGDSPQRGDIYHVSFGLPIGPHYAVVVTADVINRNANTVLVAIITSMGMDKVYPHEFAVPKGLLPKPSKVKCHALIMVPKAELNRNNYVTTINQRDMQGLDIALLKALDLWV